MATEQTRSLGRLLITPAVAALFVWMIVPLVMTIYFSTLAYNLLNPGSESFIGLENYTYFLTDPSFLRDPYPTYERLHAQGVSGWDEGRQMWLVWGYAETYEALRSPQLSVHTAGARLGQAGPRYTPVVEAVSRFLTRLDGPAHSRIRGLLLRAFTPRAVEKIKGLDATGAQSRLGEGIRKVLTELRGVPPTAILLLSDGQTTDGETLADAAEFSRRKGVPLIEIGLGDPEPARDLERTPPDRRIVDPATQNRRQEPADRQVICPMLARHRPDRG